MRTRPRARARRAGLLPRGETHGARGEIRSAAAGHRDHRKQPYRDPSLTGRVCSRRLDRRLQIRHCRGFAACNDAKAASAASTTPAALEVISPIAWLSDDAAEALRSASWLIAGMASASSSAQRFISCASEPWEPVIAAILFIRSSVAARSPSSVPSRLRCVRPRPPLHGGDGCRGIAADFADQTADFSGRALRPFRDGAARRCLHFRGLPADS